MIQSDQITLPAEFRVALYENLIQRLEKKDSFLRIYRDGDHHAAKIPDLVVLRSTVDGFTEASQKKRQVMTGAASITVHCRFTDNQGNVLLERDINSKVRFFGANRKATDDFAKKAASAVHDYFSAAGHT